MGETGMRSLSAAVCFLALCLLAGRVFAANNEDMLPVFKKIVAEDKARFGIDVKKCRLECQRVYSEAHCIEKCKEISSELMAEGLDRERVEKEQAEAEKPLKYPEVAEKYK